MLSWLFASSSQRRILGRPAGVSGPTPWLIAIMSFSMIVVAAAGLTVSNTAGTIAKSAEHRYSVQVPDGARYLPAVVSALRSARGVSGAEAVPEADMRATLRTWLGSEADNPDLPVPAMASFDLAAGADIAAVERQVKSAAPNATIVAHRENLRPVLRSLRVLQWLALGLVALLAAAAAAAVVLAARGALDTHRFTIDVMHGMGATDVQVTQLFQRKIAIDALVGSAAGAAAAAAVLLLFTASATALGELTGGVRLGLADIMLLLLLPLALTALATWVARTAVLTALRQAL